ncbi:hypothetical protein ACIBG0_36290, partial [Nocardia sp. NPDC050630]
IAVGPMPPQHATVGPAHHDRRLLHPPRREDGMAHADDTVIEVAALMARCRCPLLAVVDGTRTIGVITASRLLQVALAAT